MAGPITLGASAMPPLRIAGQRQAAQAEARQRLVILLLLFLTVPAILLLRLIDLAVLEATPPTSRSAISAAPPRADILDRNGVELARTFEAYAISVEPRKLAGDPHRLASAIAAILTDKTAAEIYAELTHKGQFRYISRRVLPSEAKRINDLGEPAIYLRREAERLYPNFNLAAHVIGYADDRGKGAVGIEKRFDDRLAGEAGRGTPLVLALDVRVQQALEHELRGLYLDQRAKGAAGVVMDVQTGEIIAMTSLPDFNPNAPGKTDDDSRYNKVTYGGYELGSTFKALTIASGLNAGIITSMTKTFDASHPIDIAGFRIHDDHALNRWLTVPEIFIHSSNIGTARIAVEVGRDRQRAMLEQLGFFAQVDVELPERARPQYPALSNWGQLAMMTIAYGHGITVSPLHLANAYATLVNGGVFRNPTMLKRAPGDVPAGRRVFTSATSDTMRALLRLVVTNGTGRKANAAGYRVGGKTGTAEKIVNGRYQKGANVSTFAAVFPMDAPRYVIVAMVDDPRGSKTSFGFKTAGMVVAPAIGRLVQRIGPILGITPDDSREIDVSGLLASADDAPKESGVPLGDLVAGGGRANVTGFALDHRKVAPGTVFGAFAGARVNGEDFIPAAIAAGAIAVVTSSGVAVEGAVVVHADEPRAVFARLAARFFGPFPAVTVAVTGTNGKTSTAELTRQLWHQAGHVAASIGTLGVTTAHDQVATGLTTPDVVTFLATMAGLQREGISHASFEASSHGLDQFRTEGLPVAAAAFTNLSRDHLDYHGTMAAYFAAKLRLFSDVVDGDGAVVVWADDGQWSAGVIAAATARGLRLLTVGRMGDTLKLVSATPTMLGQTLVISADGQAFEVKLPLIGAYQAANALVAAGLVIATGGGVAATLGNLARVQPVRGRLERAVIARSGAAVYVDYAHTPDALAAAIAALRPHLTGRLHLVFGAGGDRDTGKRALMGAIAARDADTIIVTDDNPRSEAPAAIRAAILAAIAGGAIEIADRRSAIETAIAAAGAGDIVLIAGKGHEQGQIIGDQILPFDDVSVARAAAA